MSEPPFCVTCSEGGRVRWSFGMNPGTNEPNKRLSLSPRVLSVCPCLLFTFRGPPRPRPRPSCSGRPGGGCPAPPVACAGAGGSRTARVAADCGSFPEADENGRAFQYW